MFLVQFCDKLTGFISEENQSEANLLIRRFILDFEKTYKYEDAVLDIKKKRATLSNPKILLGKKKHFFDGYTIKFREDCQVPILSKTSK